jgi:hypothetical protein
MEPLPRNSDYLIYNKSLPITANAAAWNTVLHCLFADYPTILSQVGTGHRVSHDCNTPDSKGRPLTNKAQYIEAKSQMADIYCIHKETGCP